jgi:hypothetical protein
MNRYDAGLLNDYGGGDVAWWHDYIRLLLACAEAHYQEQYDAFVDQHGRSSDRLINDDSFLDNCVNNAELARLIAAMPAPLMLRPMAGGGYIIAVAQTCRARYSADTAIAALKAAEADNWAKEEPSDNWLCEKCSGKHWPTNRALVHDKWMYQNCVECKTFTQTMKRRDWDRED